MCRFFLFTGYQNFSGLTKTMYINSCTQEIKNNARVTVNNDFGVKSEAIF